MFNNKLMGYIGNKAFGDSMDKRTFHIFKNVVNEILKCLFLKGK